jgi:hypothetical protein
MNLWLLQILTIEDQAKEYEMSMHNPPPSKPEDAVAKLLEKYNYGPDRVEAFIDASTTYELLVHPELQDKIASNDDDLAEYRNKYADEVKSAQEFLELCSLSSHEKAISEFAIKAIQKHIEPERVPRPE